MNSTELFWKELRKRIESGRIMLPEGDFRLPSHERQRLFDPGTDRWIEPSGKPDFSRSLGNGGFLKVRKHP